MEKCGCEIRHGTILYCSLHTAAGNAFSLLKEMLEDFESGYIANPGRHADRRRLRYEKQIKMLLAKAKGE